MNRVDISERFAGMWKRSREDAGKSQDYMAMALGVSRKTVQNWEDGTSCPNQLKALEWFQTLNLQPLPYYLHVLYPGRFDELPANASDDAIENALFAIIRDLPQDIKRKLLYCLTGNHGSSTIGIVEVMTAYLHIHLKDRVVISQSILTNYEIAEAQGNLVCPDHIKPNKDTLIKNTELGKKSVISGKPSYTIRDYE